LRGWALGQVHSLGFGELAGAIGVGLFLLWLILTLFRRGGGGGEARAPGRRPSPPSITDGALGPVIRAAEAAIIALARQKVARAGAFHIGAVDIGPANLAFWITTATDAERDRLKADETMRAAFRAALAEAGYPADAIPHVGFAYESQETVSRDHGGNWWYAVK
jgi:hypothetical protein